MGRVGPLSLLTGVPGIDGPYSPGGPKSPKEPDPIFRWFLVIMGLFLTIVILAVVI